MRSSHKSGEAVIGKPSTSSKSINHISTKVACTTPRVTSDILPDIHCCQGPRRFREVAGYWIFGFFLWSLIEYCMHRVLFHIDSLLPDNRVGITLHFMLHGIYHFFHIDKLRLITPTTLFIILAAPFWQLAQFVLFYNWYAALVVLFGDVFGCVGYDVTHYCLHHRALPKRLVALKKYHLRHHFTDHERGV